jgi:death-on-curing family protein
VVQKFKASKDLIEHLYQLIDQLHIQIIEQSGGERGIRDIGGLYHSINRVVNKIQKFREDPAKIACFCYKEFARRHHFNDGNKRTAHLVANIALFLVGHQFNLNYKEATTIIIKLAAYDSTITDEQLLRWVKINLQPINSNDIRKYLKEIINKSNYGEKENE